MSHERRPIEYYYKVETDGCWIWIGAYYNTGYGKYSEDWRKMQRPAHIVMYEREVGPVPDGLQLDHLCRNRGCVNPVHLEPVTLLENVRRGKTCKINFEIAKQIKEDIRNDMSTYDLMRKYSVSKSLLIDIKREKSWRDA